MLWARGELTGAELADAVVMTTGIFIGAVAVEDGLRNMIRIWTGQQPIAPVQASTQLQPDTNTGARPPKIVVEDRSFGVDRPFDNSNGLHI